MVSAAPSSPPSPPSMPSPSTSLASSVSLAEEISKVFEMNSREEDKSAAAEAEPASSPQRPQPSSPPLDFWYRTPPQPESDEQAETDEFPRRTRNNLTNNQADFLSCSAASALCSTATGGDSVNVTDDSRVCDSEKGSADISNHEHAQNWEEQDTGRDSVSLNEDRENALQREDGHFWGITFRCVLSCACQY
jgi:hypothetical protein